MSKMSVVCSLIAVAGLWTGVVHSEDKEGKENKHADREHRREKAAEKEPQLDLDKDGKINHGELRKVIDEEIDAVDSNNDGKIDRAEHKKALKDFRKKLDQNKDGKLSKEELQSALAHLKEKHPGIYGLVIHRIHERRKKHDGNKEENKEKREKARSDRREDKKN